jgi:hypothetical protein
LCGIHRKSYDVLLRTTASEAGATAAWVEQNRKKQERAQRAQELEAHLREARLRNDDVSWVEEHARLREEREDRLREARLREDAQSLKRSSPLPRMPEAS